MMVVREQHSVDPPQSASGARRSSLLVSTRSPIW
jgi:hypothetical protein